MSFNIHYAPNRVAILRKDPTLALQRRIEEAVFIDPTLAGPAEMLLRPLMQLNSCWREAYGALGELPLAASRLRLHLAAASPWSSWLKSVTTNFPAHGFAEAYLPASSRDVFLKYTPGIIHEGALVILALAAIRITRDEPTFDSLLNIPFGLAIAAGPAEVLSNLGPHAPSGSELGDFLRGIADQQTDKTTRVQAPLSAFWVDANEQARWHNLIRLHNIIVEDTKNDFESAPNISINGEVYSNLWDGAFAHTIASVDRVDESKVLLTGTLPMTDKRSIVFGGPEGWKSVAKIVSDVDTVETTAETTVDELTVEVPQEAPPGWIGIADSDMLTATNTYREALRERWKSRSDDPIEFPNLEFPEALMPLISGPFAMPPLLSNNRYESLFAAPNREERLLVVFRPVVLDNNTQQQAFPVMNNADGQSVDPLDDELIRIGESLGIEFRIVKGLPAVPDCFAVVSGPIYSKDDSRVGHLLDALCSTAIRSQGGESALWLVVLPDRPDAKIATYYNQLNNKWHRAIRTPGACAAAVSTASGLQSLIREIETRGWFDTNSLSFPYLRVVGKLMMNGSFEIEEVREETREWQARTMNDQRLTESNQTVQSRDAVNSDRILLNLDFSLRDRNQGIEEKTQTDYALVQLDKAERILGVYPISIIDKRRPASVCALIPAAHDTRSLSIRRIDGADSILQNLFDLSYSNSRDLFRIAKPCGKPLLKNVFWQSDKGLLTWSYSHTNGNGPRLVLELSRGGIWTPAADIHVCGPHQARLNLNLFESFDGARLGASDGWNLTYEEATGTESGVNGAQPLPQNWQNNCAGAIRRVDENRWWTNWPVKPEWRFVGRSGSLTQTGSVFNLTALEDGILTLVLPRVSEEAAAIIHSIRLLR